MMYYILLPCYVIVWIAIAYAMNYIEKPKETLLLGVNIPKEQLNCPEVRSILKRYQIRKKFLYAGMIFLLVLGWFFRKYSMISNIYFMIVMFGILGVVQIEFFRVFDEMYAAKSKNEWLVGEQFTISSDEFKNRKWKKSLAYEVTRALVWCGFTTLMIWLGVVSLMERKVDFPVVTIAIGMTIAWIGLVGIGAANNIYRKCKQLRSRQVGSVIVDEDIYWYGGNYSNPKDSKFLVDKRNGFGLTINNARKSAKVLNACTVIFVIGILAWMLFYIPMDFPFVHLNIRDDMLYVEATSYGEVLPISVIERAEMIEELPKMYRNEGYAEHGYDLGKFRVVGYGQCKVYITRQQSKYLVLYVGDHIYIVNSDDDTELNEVILVLENQGVMTE